MLIFIPYCHFHDLPLKIFCEIIQGGSSVTWQEDYLSKLISVTKAAEVIKSGDIVYTSAGPSCPIDVINAVSARYKKLENVHIASGLLMYPFDYLKVEYKGHLTHHSGFLGPLERMFMPQGNINVRPCQFSKVDKVIPRRHYDVAIFEVSAPNDKGCFSFGPQGTFNNAIISRYTDKIIVQVNRKTPFVNGMEGHIHVGQVDFICEKDHDLTDLSLSQSAEALIAIAHPAFRDQLRRDALKAGLLN
jgi:4-hydroxybutyrate CoA-transferase